MEKICVICEEEIKADPNGWNGGHNAQPVAKGRCCGTCNDTKVIQARLKNLGYGEDSIEKLAKIIQESNSC